VAEMDVERVYDDLDVPWYARRCRKFIRDLVSRVLFQQCLCMRKVSSILFGYLERAPVCHLEDPGSNLSQAKFLQ
jgi:hypothetical protein